jgi:uncharacterized damage-inducible protein DinB
MTRETLQGLYGYHRWGNRRLFELTSGLGEEVAAREVGRQFSFPTLKGMFAHVYAADLIWLERWKGGSPGRLLGDEDFPDLATLRRRWDDFEKEQAAFVEVLSPADLDRPIEYRSALFGGKTFRLPLWTLLQHVANHATHHRSEIATMLTMLSGSPPSTDLVVYQLIATGQVAGRP